MKFSYECKKYLNNYGSFCCWDQRAKYNSDLLDPNYLWKAQYESSPFHRAIHIWADKHIKETLPIFHVDIHGKYDNNK